MDANDEVRKLRQSFEAFVGVLLIAAAIAACVLWVAHRDQAHGAPARLLEQRSRASLQVGPRAPTGAR
jgi:uncharacterized iron-regulated membrane protein